MLESISFWEVVGFRLDNTVESIWKTVLLMCIFYLGMSHWATVIASLEKVLLVLQRIISTH